MADIFNNKKEINSINNTNNTNTNLKEKYKSSNIIQEMVDEEADISISKSKKNDSFVSNTKPEKQIHENQALESKNISDITLNSKSNNITDNNIESNKIENNKNFIHQDSHQNINKQNLNNMKQDNQNHYIFKNITNSVPLLNTNGTILEKYLNEKSICRVFNNIFNELISKKINPVDFYSYTSAKLIEINDNLSKLDNYIK